MKVIAQNRDIVYSNANGESFSYAPETPTKSPIAQKPMSTPELPQKKKVDWTKAKENATKFGTFLKDTGLVDMGKQALANKFGVQNTTQNGLTPETTTQVTIEEEKPMSTGVKVAIGLGVAAVLGFIIYKATKK